MGCVINTLLIFYLLFYANGLNLDLYNPEQIQSADYKTIYSSLCPRIFLKVSVNLILGIITMTFGFKWAPYQYLLIRIGILVIPMPIYRPIWAIFAKPINVVVVQGRW